MMRRKTILVVDAGHEVRRLLRAILEPEGYEVLEASDGWGALRLTESHDRPIDLLIADPDTSMVSGIVMGRRLGRSGRKARMLFLTAHDGPLHGGFDRPGEDHLVLAKPFHMGEFREVVRAMLETPSRREPSEN